MIVLKVIQIIPIFPITKMLPSFIYDTVSRDLKSKHIDNLRVSGIGRYLLWMCLWLTLYHQDVNKQRIEQDTEILSGNEP